MNTLRIYTDAYCASQKENKPGASVTKLTFNEFEKEIMNIEVNTTNNKQEMKSIIFALQIINIFDYPTIIYTNSSYVTNAFKKGWISNWKSNDWKTTSKKDVENRDLWIELDSLMSKFSNLIFEKMPKDSSDFKNPIKNAAKDLVTKHINVESIKDSVA